MTALFPISQAMNIFSFEFYHKQVKYEKKRHQKVAVMAIAIWLRFRVWDEQEQGELIIHGEM